MGSSSSRAWRRRSTSPPSSRPASSRPSPGGSPEHLSSTTPTSLSELSGSTGATEAAGIYGFAILPEFQGRGIGRQVLSSLARELRAEGMAQIGLEVSCNNDSALHLYLTCGFDVTGTEDYYAVQPGGPHLDTERAVHSAIWLARGSPASRSISGAVIPNAPSCDGVPSYLSRPVASGAA